MTNQFSHILFLKHRNDFPSPYLDGTLPMRKRKCLHRQTDLCSTQTLFLFHAMLTTVKEVNKKNRGLCFVYTAKNGLFKMHVTFCLFELVLERSFWGSLVYETNICVIWLDLRALHVSRAKLPFTGLHHQDSLIFFPPVFLITLFFSLNGIYSRQTA